MKTRLPAVLAALVLLAGCATDSSSVRIVQDFDTPPKPLSTPAPQYPKHAMEAGIEGESEMDFVVTRDGRVVEPAFLTQMAPSLKEAVIDATKKWRFQPAMKAGTPVDSRLKTRVAFRRTDSN
jgi:protein TonB